MTVRERFGALVNALARRFAWWWGFWHWRPRVYVHNTQLKAANEFARRTRRTVAWLEKNAQYRRPHHRDLLTGMVVALSTGLVTARGPRAFARPRCRRASVKGAKLVGKPLVYERRYEPSGVLYERGSLAALGLKKPVQIIRVGETAWLDDS